MMTVPVHLRWYLVALCLGLGALGCESGGVGDPCIPEDEYHPGFNGFGAGEVNIESRSFQCETRVCLVNHFQGRVSCPYGQLCNPKDPGCMVSSPPGPCHIPGTPDLVEAAVNPQLEQRQADKAVYCSCRCDGPDKNARYCDCPSGYACAELVKDLGLGGGQLAGSYCIKDGTLYRGSPGNPCQPGSKNCDEDKSGLNP